MDGTLAAVLVVVVSTGDETLSIRGISGDDRAENKDVGESARGRVSFTKLLLTVFFKIVKSAPLRP